MLFLLKSYVSLTNTIMQGILLKMTESSFLLTIYKSKTIIWEAADILLKKTFIFLVVLKTSHSPQIRTLKQQYCLYYLKYIVLDSYIRLYSQERK